jgi:biopolymer transport protein ExbD
MAHRAKFARKSRVTQSIPTASMGDIVFLLLVFFMVTTIFKLEDGLPVKMPKAEAAVRVPRERVAHIWIDRASNISINDRLIPVSQVEPIIYGKLVANPALIVAFNTDKQVPFRIVDEVMEELKKANATRVSFTAEFEKTGS